MFSQATLRLSSSNWTISSEAQSICEEAKKAVAKKRTKRSGASIKILIGPSIKIWYPEHLRPGRMYQVRWEEKPYCELDDDVVRHCSSISEHNARNPAIALLDDIWRSVGRNLTICRQKSGNLPEEIAALLGSSYSCPAISGFPHNRGPWTLWHGDGDDQSLNAFHCKIHFNHTAICIFSAASMVCQTYGGIKWYWIMGYLDFPVFEYLCIYAFMCISLFVYLYFCR